MNAVRLTRNILRLSGPLPFVRSTFNAPVLRRLAHQAKRTIEERNPVNHRIPFETVQLINTDGKLEPPEPLGNVLARVDLKKFFVGLVTTDKALVKVYNKVEEKAKAKARAKAQKALIRSNDHKEIQMTWGVASGDLAHKLGKARKELEKQARVDLIFAPKSKQPPPSPHERREKVAEVLEILKDVGTEWMPRTIKNSSLTIHLRGIN